MFSFWRRSNETPNEKLQRAFKIDDRDLEANRKRIRTEHQISLLRAQNLREIVANIISIITIGLGAGWLITQKIYQIYRGMEFMSVVGATILIVAIFYFLKDQRDLFRDWREAVVTRDRDMIRRQAGKGSRTIIGLSSKQRLAVSHQVYGAFVKGQTYILYYTPRSKRLVAAEHIPTNARGK